MAVPLCIVGPPNSGKTMLLESLVGTLSPVASVATIKSVDQNVSVDTPGKDTHRHRMASGETVVGVTPTLSFAITPGGKQDEESDAAVLASTVENLQKREYDIILIEGFKTAPYPKIVLGDCKGVAPPVIAQGTINSFDIEELAAGFSTTRYLKRIKPLVMRQTQNCRQDT